MKLKYLSIVTFASVLLMQVNLASANDLIPTCESCHGAGGKEPIAPNYPVLAGQYEDYLAQSLKAYRDGDRTNVLMAPQATGLTDQDIEELASYFAEQEGL